MIRSPRTRARRAGKTLVEMMLVVTGTAALLGVGGTTLHALRRVGGAARASADAGAALSRLHRTLCEDAAAADAVSAAGDRLTFTPAAGPAVVYAADDGAITRRVGDAMTGERFAVGASGAAFAAAGGRASVAFDRAGTPDELRDGLAVKLVAHAGGTE